MMADGKFKVWSKRGKKWLSPTIIHIRGDGSVFWNEGGCCAIEDRDDYIIVWDTGLPDKNGKEGYHKDVVEDKYRDRFIIEWDRGGFQLVSTRSDTIIFNIRALNQMTIIGDAFSSPELLKKD